jgi:hypothetical protein
MKALGLLFLLCSLPAFAQEVYEPLCGANPVQSTPTEVGPVVVYGDSIASQGWPQKLGWQADGRGCRSLFNDPNPAPRLLQWSSRAVWIAIGTNDYYLSKWSPAAFGAAYGALLDALSTRRVYAQTPLLRKTDPLNAFGVGLDAYRQAIIAECATRAWCTYIDGRYLVPVSMLADTVHPNADGYLVYAINARSVYPVLQP